MTSPRPTISRVCIGLAAVLTLAACGGGSDDAPPIDASTEPGDSSGDAGPSGGGVIEVSGSIDLIFGDGATNYTITLPEGFEEVEPISATTPRFENPTLEFGERSTRVELLYAPEPDDAAGLVESWMAVNSTVTVIDQADEDGLSWFTYRTPSSSEPDKIAFGSATLSLALADGSGLQCRALTQNGIDEDWSESEADAIAENNLAICRTMMAG